jgi:hypothetical protein
LGVWCADFCVGHKACTPHLRFLNFNFTDWYVHGNENTKKIESYF